MNLFVTKTTLFVNRLLALVMVVLLFALPPMLDWYANIRPLTQQSAKYAILIGFYGCALAVFPALWNLDVLLRNILRRDIFIRRNVTAIRRVRWYCMAVSAICLPASFFYQPLIFMVIIMFFLALILSVLGEVMAAAVEIREENDLTV
ncbi:MAG: DUF2975 domain-containing protein [Oscillospiraceae bacterium]|nr:DUF2975 domain-containing protein [Oscillospiraceae bacterium]